MRKYVIGGFILLIALIYTVRLFDLQINDSSYKKSADSNAFLRKTVYPSRGLMYDRNGELVVYNQPAYDVMLIPKDVQPFDTLDFCNTLNIHRSNSNSAFEDMKDKRLNPGYSSYTQQRLISQLSSQDYGRLQEKIFTASRGILHTETHTPPVQPLGGCQRAWQHPRGVGQRHQA